MKNENVRFRAGPLPEDFIRALATISNTTVSKIKEMVATCILCGQEAEYTVVGLGSDWFGTPKTGKLRLLLYGLCEACGALPDVLRKVQALALEDFVALVC
jgi:hypothetical protein